MGCRPDDPTPRRLERRSDDLGDPRYDERTPTFHGARVLVDPNYPRLGYPHFIGLDLRQFLGLPVER